MSKYMDYETLERLNKSSIRHGRNRNLYLERLPIDRDKLYPVAFVFLHNDVEMRLQLVFNRQGESAWLDISLEEYTELPEYVQPGDLKNPPDTIGQTHTSKLSA